MRGMGSLFFWLHIKHSLRMFRGAQAERFIASLRDVECVTEAREKLGLEFPVDSPKAACISLLLITTHIVSKASRLLGMLARVLISADTKTRKVAYEILVRPVLEYECEFWDPQQKKTSKN